MTTIINHLVEGLDHGKEGFKRRDLDTEKTCLTKDRLRKGSQNARIGYLDKNPRRLEGREYSEPRQSQWYHKAQGLFSVHALEPDRKYKFRTQKVFRQHTMA